MYFDDLNSSLTFRSSYMFSSLLVLGLIYLGLFPNSLAEISIYGLADLFNT